MMAKDARRIAPHRRSRPARNWLWGTGLLAVLLILILPACHVGTVFPGAKKIGRAAQVLGTGPARVEDGSRSVGGASVDTSGDTGELRSAPGLLASLTGRVEFPSAGSRRAPQSTTGEVLDSATVTLLNSARDVLASGITDRYGAFKLDLSFSPVASGSYLLEATRGLGNAMPGSDAARLRTAVLWNGSAWLSMTNLDPATPLVVNSLTTALALISGLDPTGIPLASSLGKVNALNNPATLNAAPSYTLHPDEEILKLGSQIISYLASERDPIASVSGLTPALESLGTDSGGIGTLLTLSGKGFSPIAGRNAVSFAGIPAPIYLATATSLIVGVPPGATAGAVTVTTDLGRSGGLAFSVIALNIAVNPGTFTGAWRVVGVSSGWERGAKTLPLSLGGVYSVNVDGFEPFSFAVGPNGNVAATGSAIGGSGVLDFNTVALVINPNAETLQWLVLGLSSWQYGTQTITVLKNNAGTISLNGATFPIRFVVDEVGGVTVPSGLATGGLASLTLATGNVAINLGGYVAGWSLAGIGSYLGNQTIAVARGNTYQLSLSGARDGPIAFSVDLAGLVSTDTARATGAPGTLTLPTVSVTFNANGFAGDWYFSTAGWINGSQTYTLARNCQYEIYLAGEYLPVSVSALGDVTLPSSKATGGVGSLLFNTQAIAFNVNGIGSAWRAGGLTSNTTTGNKTYYAIRGAKYTLSIDPYWDALEYEVDQSGNVVSQDGKATGGPGTLTFNTVGITVDANGFTNSWRDEAAAAWKSGNGTITAIKGIRTQIYSSWTGYTSVWCTIRYGTDNALTVTGPMAANSAGVIRFNTLALGINANGFTGSWTIYSVIGWTSGNQVLTILRGNIYSLYFDSGECNFYVGPDGTVVPDGSGCATAGPASLTFSTTTVAVSTTGSWRVDNGAPTTSGSGTATLVRGIFGWRFNRTGGSQQLLETRGNGTVSPNSFSLDGIAFSLSP